MSAQTPKKETPKEESLFIKVRKGDDVIEVHPLSLENHKQLGWVEVQPENKED